MFTIAKDMISNTIDDRKQHETFTLTFRICLIFPMILTHLIYYSMPYLQRQIRCYVNCFANRLRTMFKQTVCKNSLDGFTI